MARKKASAIPYPAKLAKNLNQRLYRLERRGLTDQSPFYEQAEEYGLKERNYQWKLTGKGVTVRVLNATQWKKLTPEQQKEALKMWQGGMQAKTSTASGIKQAQKAWTETYQRHNPKLFEDETRARSEAERQAIIARNEAKAEQHKQFFENFWATMKDHFEYDKETWDKMMQNYDINAMVESGISPQRLKELFYIVKSPQSKHKMPKKYFGTRNRHLSYEDYYGEPRP